MAYGKLVNGVIKYHNGKKIEYNGGVILMPTIDTLNAHGIYEVENVVEDGTDQQVGNIIYHYIGAQIVVEEPYQEGDETQLS